MRLGQGGSPKAYEVVEDQGLGVIYEARTRGVT